MKDGDWKLKEQTEGKLIFQIQSNKELREIYPFDFSLLITYSLSEEGLSCYCTLQNLSSEELLYSLGAHPAFFVPFDDSLSLEDYQLDFGTNIHANYYPLSEDGFIEAGALINLLNNESTLQLKDALFVNDALIIPDLTVNKVKLHSVHQKQSLVFTWENFDALAIWKPLKAPFICFEPWNGLPDVKGFDGELKDKKGIQTLKANSTATCGWSVFIQS